MTFEGLSFLLIPAFAIFPILVSEYYGERHSPTSYAALSTAKIFGAVLGGAVASSLNLGSAGRPHSSWRAGWPASPASPCGSCGPPEPGPLTVRVIGGDGRTGRTGCHRHARNY